MTLKILNIFVLMLFGLLLVEKTYAISSTSRCVAVGRNKLDLRSVILVVDDKNPSSLSVTLSGEDAKGVTVFREEVYNFYWNSKKRISIMSSDKPSNEDFILRFDLFNLVPNATNPPKAWNSSLVVVTNRLTTAMDLDCKLLHID